MISVPTDRRTKKAESPSSTQPAELTSIQFRVGPDPRGPKRCLRCHQPFKKGETWQRQTSPSDPKFGSYAIGIHDRCLPKS